MWTASTATQTATNESATGVASSPDGSRTFVVGSRPSPRGDSDILITALNAATGAPLWEHILDGPIHGDDEGVALAVAPGGASVYVLGRRQRTTPTGARAFEFVTAAFRASDGTLQWQAAFDGGSVLGAAADAAPLAIAASAGGVFVTGRAREGDSRQYLECRRALVDALGVEPAEETSRLQAQILAGHPSERR